MYKDAEGGFEANGFKDFDECYEKTLNLMTMVNFGFLTVTNLAFLHFVLAVYTHWKNADLSQALGGCPKLEANGNNQLSSQNGINNDIEINSVSL